MGKIRYPTGFTWVLTVEKKRVDSSHLILIGFEIHLDF
jgi:hypothetical protein